MASPITWSGRRVSNSRPQPWQGCALPTELLPHCPACAASCRTTRCQKIWSGRRVSNSRPQPWQGCALPTELLPHLSCLCSALPYNTLPEKSGAGDESRTRDLNLGKVALYQLSYSRMLRYCFPVALTSPCSGEARLCRRHIRVSRAFPALFPKTCAVERGTQVTRRRARGSAATRASCSTASTRSSAPPRGTSATRPTRVCRSSRCRAAAARRTAASGSRPSGTRS